MGYVMKTDIEIKLKIPKEDLPLESDVILGKDRPVMRLPTDECSYTYYEPTEWEEELKRLKAKVKELEEKIENLEDRHYDLNVFP